MIPRLDKKDFCQAGFLWFEERGLFMLFLKTKINRFIFGRVLLLQSIESL